MFFLPVLFAGVCKAATVATVASTIPAATITATTVAVAESAAAKAFVSGAYAAHCVKNSGSSERQEVFEYGLVPRTFGSVKLHGWSNSCQALQENQRE